jgi:hypothetical protein
MPHEHNGDVIRQLDINVLQISTVKVHSYQKSERLFSHLGSQAQKQVVLVLIGVCTGIYDLQTGNICRNLLIGTVNRNYKRKKSYIVKNSIGIHPKSLSNWHNAFRPTENFIKEIAWRDKNVHKSNQENQLQIQFVQFQKIQCPLSVNVGNLAIPPMHVDWKLHFMNEK